MLHHGQETTTQSPVPACAHALRDEDLRGIVAALRRYAMVLVRNPAEADDLVQESLTRAITYNPEGIGVRRWRPYLFSILHNVYVDQRSRAAKIREMMPLVDTLPQVPFPPNQEARLEFCELVETLDRLPDEQRQVILLAGLEGLSYKDVAEVIDAPIGTVMSRLSRGRQALRRLMEQQGATAEASH